MSLINDMLNDLERRRGGHAPAGSHVFDGVRANAEHGAVPAAPAPRALMLSILLGLLVACAAFYALRWLDGNAPSMVHTVAAVPAARTQAESGLPATASARVTSPRPDESGAAKLDLPSAEGPGQIDPVEVEARGSSVVADVPVPAPVEAVTLQVEPATPADVVPPPSAVVEYTGSVHKSELASVTTPQHELDALLRRADDSSVWLAELAEFATAHVNLAAANLAYARALLRKNDHARAEAVLLDGLARTPSHPQMSLMLAHILLARGQVADALQRLSAVPEARRDSENNAFIAALQQRLGNHSDAINAYRRALTATPQRGAWWIGLGISLNAEAQPVPAAQAFQRALSDRALSDKLRHFAERQIGRIKAST